MPLPVRTTITPTGTSGKKTAELHGVSDSWIPSLQSQVDVFQRLGQSGTGSQIVGIRAPTVEAKGWRGESDQAAALSFSVAFEALTGEICAITDDWGRTISAVRLTNCRAFPRRTSGPVISGATFVKFRVEVSWTAECISAVSQGGPTTTQQQTVNLNLG